MFAEDLRVQVVENLVERELVERNVRKDVEGCECVVGFEHRGHDRYDHGVVEGVEDRIECREKEVGHGVPAQRAGELQEAYVGFEHFFRCRFCPPKLRKKARENVFFPEKHGPICRKIPGIGKKLRLFDLSAPAFGPPEAAKDSHNQS